MVEAAAGLAFVCSSIALMLRSVDKQMGTVRQLHKHTCTKCTRVARMNTHMNTL